ncbi:hypothetical protein L3073_18145 [Ancylomarina sp. DW003]|nr:transposase [Ancylomarina sp. DW003]MDE5424139.1 hypothetical protein [Ancylomarina sp. DW003]
MAEKFQNKYRISSARLQNWDYGNNAAYFVTICTQNREHYFGDITNGIMQLSEIGDMANKYWLEIPDHFPFVKLEEFVVMPNHVHGIIIINKPDDGKSNDEQSPVLNNNSQCRDTKFCVSTDTTYKNKFGPQSKNLASIIRGFKIGVTKNARKIHADFAWQSRFHDHIIRNDKSLHRIRDYINNNPSTWTDDTFHAVW